MLVYFYTCIWYNLVNKNLWRDKVNIRFGNENDYLELAELKLMHIEEDDLDYDETNLLNINREAFVSEYVSYGLVINQSLGMKEMDF